MANQRKYDRRVRALARLTKTIQKSPEVRDDQRHDYNVLQKLVGNGEQL
jgi:hypothetical protein